MTSGRLRMENHTFPSKLKKKSQPLSTSTTSLTTSTKTIEGMSSQGPLTNSKDSGLMWAP